MRQAASDRQATSREIRRAFTLVELLAVVAILALLLTILMPSLERAREIAKQTVCLSHQHQVGVGIMAYSATFRMKFPGADGRISSSHPDAAVREGGHHTWRHWFQYLWGPQYHILVSDDGAHPGFGEYATQRTDAIRCTKSTQGTYGMYDSDNVDANDDTADGIFMERIGSNDPECPENWEFFKQFCMNRCPAPGDFLLLGCTTDGDPLEDGRYAFHWWVTHSNVGRRPNMGLWLTHGGQVNGLFVDGHGELCGPGRLVDVANERPRRSFDPDWGGPGIKGWMEEDGTLFP